MQTTHLLAAPAHNPAAKQLHETIRLRKLVCKSFFAARIANVHVRHLARSQNLAALLATNQQNPERFPLDAATFLVMHTVLVGAASGKKSAYRQKDYVNMMMDGQVQRVPASPILAFETPLYLGSACDNLASAFAEAASRKLMMIPTFAVDVMCIKPFDEGTGRLARLFSLLLMERAARQRSQRRGARCKNVTDCNNRRHNMRK